jgi:hypothetical protein
MPRTSTCQDPVLNRVECRFAAQLAANDCSLQLADSNTGQDWASIGRRVGREEQCLTRLFLEVTKELNLDFYCISHA